MTFNFFNISKMNLKSKKTSVLFLLVSCFLFVVLFASGGQCAPSSGATFKKEVEGSSSTFESLSKEDLSRILQLLAGNYNIRVEDSSFGGNILNLSLTYSNPNYFQIR